MVLSTSELKPTANIAGIQSSSLQFQAMTEALLPTKELLVQVQERYTPLDLPTVIDCNQPQRLLLPVPAQQTSSNIFASSEPTPYLQTYDTASARHVSRQALTRTNATDKNTGPEGNRVHEPSVSQLAISRNGKWLASVETWLPPRSGLQDMTVNGELDTSHEQARCKEIHLRFWHWDEKESTWKLNTRIESPHQFRESHTATDVLHLIAHPFQTTFVSVGADSIVKFWTPKTKRSDRTVIRGERTRAFVSKKKDVETWWSVNFTIPLERSSQGLDVIGRRIDQQSPKAANLAFSNDGSTMAANLDFSHLVSDRQLKRERLFQPTVHFIDAEGGVIRFSTLLELHSPDLGKTNFKDLNIDSNINDTTIHSLAFVGQTLLILTESALKIFSVTSLTFTASIPLTSPLTYSSLSPASRSIIPNPQLSVNLSTNTFAVSIPVPVPDPKALLPINVKLSDLPPHPYRDFTSRIFVFSAPEQSQTNHDSHSKKPKEQDSWSRVVKLLLATPPLPHLVLSLTSCAGVQGDASSEREYTRREAKHHLCAAQNAKSQLQNGEQSQGLDIIKRGNESLELEVRKRGYLLVDVGAQIRTVKPEPVDAGLDGKKKRKDRSSGLLAIESGKVHENGDTTVETDYAPAAPGAQELARESDNLALLRPRMADTNGERGERRVPGKMPTSAQLAEAIGVGQGMGEEGNKLPDVRDMFDRVADLFCGRA